MRTVILLLLETRSGAWRISRTREGSLSLAIFHLNSFPDKKTGVLYLTLGNLLLSASIMTSGGECGIRACSRYPAR